VEVVVLEGLAVAEIRVGQLRLVKVLLAVHQAVLLVLVEEVLQLWVSMVVVQHPDLAVAEEQEL
jgi:hypothetical protein